jgi:hypothetical protein
MRPPTRHVFALLLVLAALGSVQVPAALGAEPMHVLMGGTDTSTRWTGYKLTSTGASYQLRWDYEMEKDPVQFGIYFYDSNDTFKGGFSYTAYTYQNSARYEVNAVPGNPLVGEQNIEAFGYKSFVQIGGPLAGTPEKPEVTKLLIWSSGALSKGLPWEFKATPGAELVTDLETGLPETTTGSSAFVHLSEDFGGAANVGVQASSPRVPDVVPNGIGPGARASVLGFRTYEVKDSLVGGFVRLAPIGPAFGAQANAVMRVTNPSGFQQDCSLFSCSWYHLKPQDGGLTPGPYRFELSGAGVGVGPFGDVLLWGVDAKLPA